MRNPLSSPHPRELTTKRRGELAELAFTLKAATLGFGVAKPYGDSERYDFILDARNNDSRNDDSRNDDSRSDDSESDEAGGYNRFGCPILALPLRKSGDFDFALNSECPNAPPEAAKPALHRVQVKCSTQLNNGLYRVNAHRRTNGRAVPYLPGEIDFFAAYIIPEDTWYILPFAALRGRTSLLFRRRDDPKPGLYDAYREAWHLLRR